MDEVVIMIIIATHALFINGKDVYGPAHAVSLFLNKTRRNHIFIKHSAEGMCLSQISYYKDGKLYKSEESGTKRVLPFGVRHLVEFFISLKVTLATSGKYELFVGADPLNAFAGNMLVFIGKVDKTIFLSADFSLQRFQSKIMSQIYILLDRAAMFWSAQTWSVSKRILDYRKNRGLSDMKNKILPNAPFFDDVPRVAYKDIHKHDLVLVSALKKGIVPFVLLIDAIEQLSKRIMDTRLLIIGGGSEEKALRDYVLKKKLDYCVKFYGALSHSKMFSVLVKSAIGIAIYEKSDKNHFRYFSDSMRTRDYLASGLPVFFSGSSGIGSEILERDAGKIVKLEKKAIIAALEGVLTKQVIYQKLRNNALTLAKEYDTYALLKKYLAFLD